MLLQAGAPHAEKALNPGYGPLTKAYESLRAKDYASAISSFNRAIEVSPLRAGIRKDLAYTYLKTGEAELARFQFGEAMRLDPNDFHVALEYAFLCFEAREQANSRKAEARRIFDRIRSAGDPASRSTAERALRNIDDPLKAGIARWLEALTLSSSNFSAHHELATLFERRDDLENAAEHYLKAWRLRPERKSVLLDLGRTWKSLNRVEDANSALLAASRGGEPRAAEAARELLPARYPYVYEFEKALQLDPGNVELRRELGYLQLKMNHPAEAERQFRAITQQSPEDLLSAAQLGFLFLARKDLAGAMPLLDRVLAGKDEELSNRVRAALGMPQNLRERPETPRSAVTAEARVMAERSIQAGYMKDALRYLTIAHESDPVDFEVMLKLGWTHNTLKNDGDAIRWFALAKRSPDPKVAQEAGKAYSNLRPALARVRTTGWIFPVFSSRWKDVFSYGQIKAELKLGKLPFRPYISTRFIGDLRRTTGGPLPQYLSESAFIVGLGVATNHWRGAMAWAEAGTAIGYLNHQMLPDYRGGVAWARSFGTPLGGESPGAFYETTADGVYISRFGKDFLAISQHRLGYSFSALPVQIYWNGNATIDARRQYWANFAESGPGIRFRLPSPLLLSVSFLRGVYFVNGGNPRGPNFFDVRAGFWYAFTH